MNRVLNYICLLVVALLFHSCSLIGINLYSKTPRHEKPYPVFSKKDSLRGTLGPLRAWYDVHYYDLNLDVDIEKQYLNGYVDMHYKTLKPAQTLQFDLYANMKINRIEFQNQSLNYTREYNSVFVPLPSVSQPGESGIIRIYYEGSPMVAKRPPWKGGFVWKKDKNGKPWIGVACEGDGASLWWPLKDHGSDEPDSCGINITIPQGLFCVANGVLQSRTVKENKETFRWKVSYPINRYNVNFSIGDYAHFTVPYTNGTEKHELHFYPLAYHLDKAEPHFKHTVEIIQYFEKAFGEYPWWNDDYKLIETPFMGMEHQTAIAYGNKYKNFFYYDFDQIILHETAHEWWGNSLTAVDFCDVWLQEGFATYSEALYVEHHYSYNEYLKFLSLYRVMIKNNHPVIGPSGVDYFYYKDTDVYMKGAWFLHSLRTTINQDTVFFDILKTFPTRFRGKTVTTKDFQDIVNEKTGADYDWFFFHYLHRREVPELMVAREYSKENGEHRLYFKWGNVRHDFKLPVSVTVRYHNQELNYNTSFTPGVNWKYIVLDEENAPNSVIYHSWDAYYRIKKTNHPK